MRRARNYQPHEVVISRPLRVVAGCSGKRCYETKAVAARLAQRTRRDREIRVSEYRCVSCHFWHIGEL